MKIAVIGNIPWGTGISILNSGQARPIQIGNGLNWLVEYKIVKK